MCSKKQQIPDIRFNGFTDAWEQRKLGELASFSKGAGYTKGDLTATGKPIILYGRLYTKYEAVIENVDTFVDEKEKSVISNGNEVIVPASGETSEDISRASVVAKPGIILGGDLNIVKPKKEIDPLFLALTISNGRQQKELSKKAQGKSVVHLHNSDLKEVNLVYPQKKEQTKIGTFFKQLDDTIALHQRQLDNYKELKKAMLQKMFPREGEKVPEVRFDGFTEEWEQRKLGEILIERNDQISENEEYPLMSFVQGVGVTPKGERYDRSFLVKDDAKKYKKTELGDFIYSSNNLETGSIGFNKMGKAVISPVYSIFESKNETESQFIGIFSTRKDFINKMVHYRQGVVYGQWRIHEKDFLNIEVSVPSFEEQQKIIIFFKQLDDTIALYQQKIINYQTVKSALFKKMFV